MISIVIPLYNKALYIKETIYNILNQTYQDFELIVVNDGSNDNGPKLVQSFTDKRIKLINKPNGGVSSARNIGIQHAKYEYIAFLDADDEWLPNHLEEIHKLILDFGNRADVFVTNFARKYPSGKIVPNRLPHELNEGIVKNYFKEVIKKAVINASCVCVSKVALHTVKGFDERISRGEDIDVWIKLAREYNIVYSPIVTANYLQDAINNSRKRFDITKSVVYYLDLNDLNNSIEKRFLIKILWKKYFSLLIKDKDVINFKKLFLKQGIKL